MSDHIYNVEFAGVIVAESQDDADALAELIAKDTTSAYRFRIADGPNAVVASMSSEVVISKKTRGST